ncbi:MAG: hypothetical protein ACPG6L_06255, partial [Nereida ignava]
MNARVIDVTGIVQRADGVIHLVAHHLEDRSDALDRLSDDTIVTTLARADEIKKALPSPPHGHPRDACVIPKSRDFH